LRIDFGAEPVARDAAMKCLDVLGRDPMHRAMTEVRDQVRPQGGLVGGEGRRLAPLELEA
jgi:hypothetical protein